MTEANYSFTTKVNGDLFTVRGNSIEEFTMNLLGAQDGSLVALVRDVQAAAAGTPAPPIPTHTPYVAPAPVEQSAQVSSGPTQFQCPHGLRVHKSGSKKDGGKWEAYFCPIKGTDCKPMNADGSFWK